LEHSGKKENLSKWGLSGAVITSSINL